ncbi:MAG: AMP-binding protein, partial [Pedobacter sp.]|nr:AMP-binding protein [Pedobacter sp.]
MKPSEHKQDNALLWQPDMERIAATRMAAWQRWLARERGLVFDDYAELHAWSVQERETFWQSIADYFSVKFHDQPVQALAQDSMPGANWFPDSTLNFAEHLLRYRDERTALVSYLENGERRSLTYAELYRDVSRLAAWMKSEGVSKGDRVAGFMPNIQEAVIAMLAATSLG